MKSGYYVVKQNGVVTGAGFTDELNFNAGYPEGFEWVDEMPDMLKPPPKRILTKPEAMDRFTDEELEDIYTAAASSVAVQVWLEKFKAAQDTNLDDPRFIAGLDKLVTAGLLAPNRPAEILV